jgi:hypothetical protein
LGPTASTDSWASDATPSGHPFEADIDCSAADIAAKFAVAGDFDGDGQDELVIAVDLAASSPWPATSTATGKTSWS